MSTASPKSRLRVPDFDPAAVARAEAALKVLSAQFNDWMVEEIERLEDALRHAEQHHFEITALAPLLARAHDVKGLAATYEFPLATRLADVVCRLLETEQRQRAARRNRGLLTAAVQAIRACVRDNIRSERDSVGALVAKELDRRAAEAIQDVNET